MRARSIPRLLIDEEFHRIIPPLLPDERSLLEESLQKDGCTSPIVIWHGVIVDGHNRYEICHKLGISFRTVELSLEKRSEVIDWICSNQLGRRNLTDESRRYLIGMRYEMEKVIGVHNAEGANQYSANDEDGRKIYTEPLSQHEQNTRTRERLGCEYNINPSTVTNYGCYARAINRINDVTPALSHAILRGSIKVPQDRVIKLSRCEDGEIIQAGRELTAKEGTRLRYQDSRLISFTRKLTGQPKPEARPTTAKSMAPERSVKDNPISDPDQIASALALTIPSWISMINRALAQMNLHSFSNAAVQSLWLALAELQEATEKLMKIAEGSQ